MAAPGRSIEQLRQAQDVDAIPTPAWSARPDGSAEFLNRRWLDYTGLSAEEASDWGWTAAVHTEDRDRLMDFWRHLLASGEAGEIEARLRRYDGEYRWFLFRVEPVRDNHGNIFKWYGANTDIEDRKRAEALAFEEIRNSEAKLQQDERELRQLIDFLPQHIVVMDQDGTLLQANKRLLDYLGFTLEQMKASGIDERIRRNVHPEDLERFEKGLNAGLSNRRPFETALVAGSTAWVTASTRSSHQLLP
jgi:PAS domain S-box-containing protein